MNRALNIDVRFVRILIIVLPLAVALFLSPPSVQAKDLPADGIIAVVNDEAITLLDLQHYIAGIYSQLKLENKSPQEIQEIMSVYEEKGINKLVEDKLILAAAKDKGIEIRPDAVDQRMKDIESHYPSQDVFFQALDAQGMTIGDLRKKLTDQMKAKYIVDMEVRDKVFVNPEDVTKYYKKHQSEFQRKAMVNLQSIFISFDHGKEQARSRAAEARSRLLAGEDFNKVSKEYSQAPSVGVVEEGQMVPSIEDAVFRLKLDDVSRPVEVGNGIYVFKVIGISPGRLQTLQEVKDEISNKLAEEQFEAKFKAWVAKLRKKAYVEIK